MTEKEKTAPVVSVGADTEQSILKQINNSITDFNVQLNYSYSNSNYQIKDKTSSTEEVLIINY